MPHILPTIGTPNTRPAIYNSLSSSSLNVIAVSDPSRFTDVQAEKISIYTKSVSDQMNKQRSSATPGMTCVDLEKFITDITVETTAQGAGMLTLSLIDPGWKLLETQANGTSFIDVDEFGYLWPPIEINFPEGVSDAKWRLCQVNPSSATTSANLTLVFEDVAVSEMREHDQGTDPSLRTSFPNETRAEYIRRCIKTVSKNPRTKADNGIRFIPLLPTSVFTAADLTSDETSTPSSAQQPNVTGARSDPNKTGAGFVAPPGFSQLSPVPQLLTKEPAFIYIADGASAKNGGNTGQQPSLSGRAAGLAGHQ